MRKLTMVDGMFLIAASAVSLSVFLFLLETLLGGRLLLAGQLTSFGRLLDRRRDGLGLPPRPGNHDLLGPAPVWLTLFLLYYGLDSSIEMGPDGENRHPGARPG